MNSAIGAVPPISRSHQLRLRLGSSSSTVKPRRLVTISRKELPAGPTSLLRTPESISWLIACSSACAAEPKRMIDWVLDMSISALRLSISAFDRRIGGVGGDELALGLGQEVGGDRLDVLQRGFGLHPGFLGHRHALPVA